MAKELPNPEYADFAYGTTNNVKIAALVRGSTRLSDAEEYIVGVVNLENGEIYSFYLYDHLDVENFISFIAGLGLTWRKLAPERGEEPKWEQTQSIP